MMDIYTKTQATADPAEAEIVVIKKTHYKRYIV